jgi:radical SAM-linked protein
MDLFCTRWVSPHFFTDALNQQLPAGIKILQVYAVAPTLPSLQSQVSYSEYDVQIETEKDKPDIESALASLLSAKQLPWHHERDTGTHSYDLRALIDELRLADWHKGSCTIGMRLRCDNSGSGRPEQVAAALGFKNYPKSIHRTRLILKTS